MKIELKQLAPYLPYGLKAILSQEGKFNLDSEYPNEHRNKICTITDFTTYSNDLGGSMKVDNTKDYSFDFDSLSEIEILLRPLSDLTKEIEVNGVKFIPSMFWDDKKRIELLSSCSADYQYCEYLEQFVFEQLIKWKFDVFGLLDANLAIDINSIK